MPTVTAKNGHTAHIYSNGHPIRSVDLNALEEPLSLTVWAGGGFAGAAGNVTPNTTATTATVTNTTVAANTTVAPPGTNGFNIIEAEHGRIRVAEADCRDGICTRQGWVSSGAVPIVCLPNRLVIEISGGNQGKQEVQIDGVVG